MRRYLLCDSQRNLINTVRGYDVIVVGSGIAGLYSALHLSAELSVAVVCKSNIEKGSSWYAQGGIAAVLSDDDSYRLHLEDTLKAGAGLCNTDAVEALVKEGPDNIMELVRMGVPFDSDGYGKLLCTREGGHRINRIVHCGGDATGRETTRQLGRLVASRENITVMTECYAVDVVTDDSGVCGILLCREGNLVYCPCGNVIIATGGIGQVYRYTTNPSGAVGDGIAMAQRAGARLDRMEMIQFHPTTLIPQGKTERLFLISEAVRGEGAILRNSKGEAFMQNAHDMKDLAPRDIVTRAILSELSKSGEQNVFLDVSNMSAEFFAHRFPTIYAKCKELCINLTEDMIPVRPGQHYLMGGIRTDLYGATHIPGLYACGEAACTGAHGANRLASNSMLECLVFGRRCALCINGNARAGKEVDLEFDARRTEPLSHAREAELRTRIKHKMTKYAGPVRTAEGLARARESIAAIREEIDGYILSGGYEFELYNMAEVAQTVIDSAAARKESVGAHYLADAALVK